MSKSKKSKKSNGKVQKVKVKGEVGSTLSIVIPLALIFVLLVGGLFLFIYLEEGRRVPNQAYLDAERIVKNGELIGLTLEQCRNVVGTFAIINPNDDGADWIFPAGYKEFPGGDGTRSYEIWVSHENDVAVGAALREIK